MPSSHELFEQGKRLYKQNRLRLAATRFEQSLLESTAHAYLESNLLLTLNYLPEFSSKKLAALHRSFGQRHGDSLSGLITPHTNTPDPGRRLRIGYISPDLRAHSVAFFIAPVLMHHSASEVEIYAYYNHPQQDGFTGNLRNFCHHWRAVTELSDQQLAESIRQDNIDILVDLAGHSALNRLLVLAQKPAPVQVTWLGYPNTTGLSTVDYRITDARADPEGEQQYYTEQLVRLPDSFLCYAPLRRCQDITPLPAARNGYITFGSLNNFSKNNPHVIDLWIQLLKQVPKARLVLIYNGAGKPWLDSMIARANSSAEIPFAVLRAMANLQYAQDAFAKEKLLPGRVLILGRSPTDAAHLQRYGNIDIALDPFPYNGTTTTFESLWMGVPVIALRGDRHAARVSADILEGLGLNELIGDNTTDYLRAAAGLAADGDRLSALRTSLRSRMTASALMDAPAFTSHLEAVYRLMWGRWCETHST